MSDERLPPVEPPPAVPDDPTERRAWLERLRGTVADLAADQRRLHQRFHRLAEVVEEIRLAEAAATPPATPDERTEPERRGALPARSVGRRLLYALLRRTVGTARNLWRASLAELRIEAELDPERAPGVPELGRVVEVGSEADLATDTTPGGASPHETILWHRASGRYRRLEAMAADETAPDKTAPDETGRASQVEDLRRVARSQVCLLLLDGRGGVRPGDPPLPDLSPRVVELALHVIDAQDLRFLRLRRSPGPGPELDFFFVRWPWWHPDHGVDPRRLASADATRPLGRTVHLGRGPGHRATRVGQPGATDLASYLSLWTAKKAEGTLVHRIAAAPPAGTATDTGAAVVLTHPLDAGLLAIVRRWLDAHPGALLLGLAEEGADAARPLACGDAHVYPVADFVEPLAVGITALQVLVRHRVRRILHLGPGDGFFGETPIAEWLHREGVEVTDLPRPRFPDRRVDLERPPGVRRLNPPSPSAETLPDGDAARRELGLPARGSSATGATVVAWIGDLVPGERPEDFAELAAALEDRDELHFVLAGTGPLAGTLDDLRSWHRLSRWTRTADRALACAAADVVCFTAEDPAAVALSPWPVTARAAGKTVLETGEGDVDSLVRALREAI